MGQWGDQGSTMSGATSGTWGASLSWCSQCYGATQGCDVASPLGRDPQATETVEWGFDDPKGHLNPDPAFPEGHIEVPLCRGLWVSIRGHIPCPPAEVHQIALLIEGEGYDFISVTIKQVIELIVYICKTLPHSNRWISDDSRNAGVMNSVRPPCIQTC